MWKQQLAPQQQGPAAVGCCNCAVRYLTVVSARQDPRRWMLWLSLAGHGCAGQHTMRQPGPGSSATKRPAPMCALTKDTGQT